MKIATFNINGINGRLAVLLQWLNDTRPDVACLQELKTEQGKFPAAALEKAGYGAIWHGQRLWNGVAILALDGVPMETIRGLPGDSDDTHSCYIEAAVNGILIGCLYLPNGNPAPGPKYDYKLRWFERLMTRTRILLDHKVPVVLAGDYNAIPTDFDVYSPERWRDDALFRPEVREAYRRLLEQGWTDSIRSLHPKEHIYTFWKYWRNSFARDAGLRIDHLLLSPSLRKHLTAAGVDREIRGLPNASDHAPAWIELKVDKRRRFRGVPSSKKLSAQILEARCIAGNNRSAYSGASGFGSSAFSRMTTKISSKLSGPPTSTIETVSSWPYQPAGCSCVELDPTAKRLLLARRLAGAPRIR